MLKVKIIYGTYGYKTNGHIVPKDSNDEPFLLDNAEAERLVSLGVAKIIANDVATDRGGEKATIQSITPSNASNRSNDENEGGNDIAGFLDERQLKEMTNKELKALAEDMGIETARLKTKNDYIRAIVSIEVSVSTDNENIENPPDLSLEAPVI